MAVEFDPVDAVETQEVENISILNKDVKTVDDYLARFCAEAVRAGSVPTSEVSSADLDRHTKYAEGLKGILEKLQAMPEQDKPGSHPYTVYKLDAIQISDDLPNEHMNYLFREYQSMRLELRVSQSRWKANRFHPADFNRMNIDIDTILKHLTEVVPVTQALDFPDTGGAGQSANVMIPKPINVETT